MPPYRQQQVRFKQHEIRLPDGTKIKVKGGLEKATALDLIERAVANWTYESLPIPYTVPERRTRYTPDFILEAKGFLIETKGEFSSKDRQKTLLVAKQHPDLDIRFIFSSPGSRLGKMSKTTYAMWCEKHGFKWAKAPTKIQRDKGTPMIPTLWLEEKPNRKSLAAIKKLRKA